MAHIANCLQRGVDRLVNTSVLRDSKSAPNMPDFYCAGETDWFIDSPTFTKGQSFDEDSPTYHGPGAFWQEAAGDETEMALSMGRTGTSLSDTAVGVGRETPISWGLGSALARRRNVRTLGLGPQESFQMVTVQEAGLDSPTIPGMPALSRSQPDALRKSGSPPRHERSYSEPQYELIHATGKEFLASTVYIIETPPKHALDKAPRKRTVHGDAPRNQSQMVNTSRSLPPLTVPTSNQVSGVKLLVDPSIKLLDDDDHPKPLQFKRDPTVQSKIPQARPVLHNAKKVQDSPEPEKLRSQLPTKLSPTEIQKTPKAPSRHRHSKNLTPAENPQCLPSQAPGPPSAKPSVIQSSVASLKNNKPHGHLRQASEKSIMDRSRPVKRSCKNKDGTESSVSDDGSWKLPNGLRPSEAAIRLSDSEKEALHKQANGQAEKFEILGSRSVASLSRELRALDERCDYLRKTYKSLRSGRVKLHNRMITYLKSDIVQFTKESLLRQEEALVELDKSIDDWMVKIEQAENRRLRVRQKLLEHVAAAMMLKPVVRSEKLATSQSKLPRGTTEAHSPPLASSKQQEVESMKIHADGQVVSLISDIEQAVTMMCEAC